MSTWASENEARQHFLDSTFEDAEERAYFERFGFVARLLVQHRFDDGEELVRLRFIHRGGTVEEREFMHLRAWEDAASYVHAMEESAERHAEAERLSAKLGREVHPLEIAFAEFGPEWEREQQERREGGF